MARTARAVPKVSLKTRHFSCNRKHRDGWSKKTDDRSCLCPKYLYYNHEGKETFEPLGHGDKAAANNPRTRISPLDGKNPEVAAQSKRAFELHLLAIHSI